MIPLELAACAPRVHPLTVEAVISVESRGNPLAVNVNRGPRIRVGSAADAAQAARYFISRGYSVDLGLMQVNSRNLRALGYSVEQMFDPCANIRAGTTVLAANYASAVATRGEGQPALLAALSAYNTGNFARGFVNGYVSRYFKGHRMTLRVGLVPVASRAQVANPYTAVTTVYSRKEQTNNGRSSDQQPAAAALSVASAY